MNVSEPLNRWGVDKLPLAISQSDESVNGIADLMMFFRHIGIGNEEPSGRDDTNDTPTRASGQTSNAVQPRWCQASRWCGATARSGGSSAAQRWSARGQRVRNRQPLGGSAGSARLWTTRSAACAPSDRVPVPPTAKPRCTDAGYSPGTGVLRDHLDHGPESPQLGTADAGSVLAVDQHFAGIGLLQVHDHPRGRGLATTRLPNLDRYLTCSWAG